MRSARWAASRSPPDGHHDQHQCGSSAAALPTSEEVHRPGGCDEHHGPHGIDDRRISLHEAQKPSGTHHHSGDRSGDPEPFGYLRHNLPSLTPAPGGAQIRLDHRVTSDRAEAAFEAWRSGHTGYLIVDAVGLHGAVAQPSPHDYRFFPDQGPTHRLAPRGTLVPPDVLGRGHSPERRELAMGGGHRPRRGRPTSGSSTR